MGRWLQFSCACAFAKSVDDRNPFHFPRVGMADDVLYRGRWIIRSIKTGEEAIIVTKDALGAEVRSCCFDWFDQNITGPTIKKGDE